jgi:hypothetical protein
LADCIQEAKDDHQNCLGDCANRAISPPSRWRLAGSTLIVRCRGQAQPSSVDGLLTVSGAILPASATGEHEQWKTCPLGLCGLSRLPLGSAQGSPFSWSVRSAGPCDRPRRRRWAGTGARRSGHCSSARVRRPAASRPVAALARPAAVRSVFATRRSSIIWWDGGAICSTSATTCCSTT